MTVNNCYSYVFMHRSTEVNIQYMLTVSIVSGNTLSSDSSISYALLQSVFFLINMCMIIFTFVHTLYIKSKMSMCQHSHCIDYSNIHLYKVLCITPLPHLRNVGFLIPRKPSNMQITELSHHVVLIFTANNNYWYCWS